MEKRKSKITLCFLTVIAMVFTLMPAIASADTSTRTETLDLTESITDDSNSDQGWAWEADSRTLTLNGVSFKVNGDAIKVPADSTILVNGSNVLSCTGYGKSVYTDPFSETEAAENCDLIIKGTGNLICSGEGTSIVTSGQLQIQDATVTTKSNASIRARDIRFINCNVNASHYTGIIRAGSPLIEAYIEKNGSDETSNITFSGCYIENGGYVMTKMFSPKYDDIISTFIGAGNEYAKNIVVKKGTIPNVTKPSITSITTNYTKNTIKWSVPKYMQGSFDVYRSTKKTSGYKKVASVNVPYYTDSKLTFNKTYYYKIKVKNTRTTAESAVKSRKTALQKPAVSVKKINSTTKRVSWNKISGAQGYKIYRATSKSGKYKLVKKVTKGSTVAWRDKSLKKNKKYYYKVKAYRVVKGKAVYGSTSSAAGN